MTGEREIRTSRLGMMTWRMEDAEDCKHDATGS
jgi:hypothetical protein